MGLTAISGPWVAFGITQSTSGAVGENNQDRAPSLYDLSVGMLDPRSAYNYEPGSAAGTLLMGFLGGRALVDYLPSAVSSNNLATNQAPTSSSLVTLTAGTGITQTTIIAPETGAASETLLCIDSTAAYLTFGSGGVAVWNPAAGTGRAISVTTSSSGDLGSFMISGRDMYGYKMSESLSVTGSSATVLSRKAFKYVSGVRASSVITSTGILVGVSDTFGLPLVALNSGVDLQIRVIATSSLASNNSSGAITTASTVTATATTSDVRGTYASSTATTGGTVRIQIMQTITPAMVNAVTPTDTSRMFGVTQYST